MSNTPRRLRAAKAEYESLAYPGDLAADIRARAAARPPRTRARVARRLLAAAALGLIVAATIAWLTPRHARPTPAPPAESAHVPPTAWEWPPGLGAIPAFSQMPTLPSDPWSLPPGLSFPAMSVPWPSDFLASNPSEKTS